MQLGRPLKGSSRRTPITVHVPANLIDVIDAYVAGHAAETVTAYTRSDFFTEAAIAMLRTRGVDTGEDQQSTAY